MEKSKAYINEYGVKIWYLPSKGKDFWHRLDGPAVEHPNGSKDWYVNGKHHREDGPAVVWIFGTYYSFSRERLLNSERRRIGQQWYINGEQQLEKQWYIDGERYSEKEWALKCDLRRNEILHTDYDKSLDVVDDLEEQGLDTLDGTNLEIYQEHLGIVEQYEGIVNISE